MKKFVTMLGIVTCIFGLTACGSSNLNTLKGEHVDAEMEAQLTDYYGVSIYETVAELAANGGYEQYKKDEPIVYAGIESYAGSAEEIGEVQGYDNKQAVINDDGDYAINIGLDGTSHDADFVLVISPDDGSVKQMTTNVRYSLGEMMEQAALNTVLGMGTTFVILILLAVIISLFAFIPKIQAAFQKKPAAAPAPAAAAPAAAPVVEEEVVDDGELIAVIAAAIAASEGRTSTDGFQVRSIRKSRKKF